jgi:acetolactate synthase-1/2/3 large subunit
MKFVGSDLLVRLLEVNDVEFIFGVPGGHLLKFYDSVRKSDKITPILTKHEAGASFMATGYAQVSEKLGVCVGTVGPGATNLMTGVASAYMDSAPIFVLTANVGISAIGKGGLQEATGEGRTISHIEIFDGATKYSSLIFDGGKIEEGFRRAIKEAINGRPGPVHLDITANTFTDDIDIDEGFLTPIQRFPVSGDPLLIEEAAEILMGADNPAILVGYGGLVAHEEILELVETYEIPVATTLRGKGIIPEDHEMSLGVVGLYGTNIANKFLRDEIDILLAIGLSFSEFTTHAWDPNFQPSKSLIQIDIDYSEIGKNYQTKLGIVGDSKAVLTELLHRMGSREKRKLGTMEQIKGMKEKRQYFSEPEMNSDSIPIKPQRAMADLRKALPDDVIVFGDIGNNLAWIEAFFQVKKPKGYYICSNLASMGYGVAASIGGQIAAPDRRVVCICGDGGFQMQGMEVVTAVNYDVPVKWFILNNGTLGMIRDTQDILFDRRRVSTDFLNPDYVKLAESMGAEGLRIERPSEIMPVTEEALKNERPTVIDILIDPDEAPSFDARAEAMVRAWGVAPSIWQKIKMIPEALRRR